MATISFVDSVGAVSFSNVKPRPANRFGNWTPDVEVIGPTATGLGTGDLHVFEFRSDYLVALEIAAIPGSEYEKMLRLKRHLEKSGEVTLEDEMLPPLILERFTTCKLAPDTKPQISFSDRTCLEYTFSVVLRSGTSGVSESEPEVLTPEEIAVLDECQMVFHWRYNSLVTLGLSGGDPVGIWPDENGNVHYGYQEAGETAGRPIFDVPTPGFPVFGFQPGVFFGGTYGNAKFFRIFGLADVVLTGATVYVVLKTELDPQGDDWNTGLWDFRNGVGFLSQTHYPYNDGVIHESFGRAGDLFTVGHPPSLDLTKPHIYSVTSIDGEMTAKHNGMLTQTTDTNTFYPAGFGATSQVGTSTPDAEVINFRGWIAEMFIVGCKPSAGADGRYLEYLRTNNPSVVNPDIGLLRGVTLYIPDSATVADEGTQSDTIVQPVPDNVRVPNLLLWVVHIGSVLASVPWPAGWTEIERITSAVDGATLAVARKAAIASEPASYTMTLVDPEWFYSTMMRVESMFYPALGDRPAVYGTSVPVVAASDGLSSPSTTAPWTQVPDQFTTGPDVPLATPGEMVIWIGAVDNVTPQSGIAYTSPYPTSEGGSDLVLPDDSEHCSMGIGSIVWGETGSAYISPGTIGSATGSGDAGTMAIALAIRDPEAIITE
jgi:hypothetical protein